MTTSYSNPGGSGCRLPVIHTTTNLADVSQYEANSLVDGQLASNICSPSVQSPTGKYIKFDFMEPVLIKEAKFYQSLAYTHGTWKWQGSNNDSDWYDIGSTFILGGSTEQTITTLNGNTTLYRYYRLYGLLGSIHSGAQWWQIEFKIKQSDYAATYLNALAMGDRTTPITTSADCFSSGSPDNLIDDDLDIAECTLATAAVAGKYIKFDFGAGNAPIIKEAVWLQYYDYELATWKWQGSNNDADWYDIGSSFTLGGALRQVQTQLNGNTTGYRYYRLLGVSGTPTSGCWLHEIGFKIVYPGNSTTTTSTTTTSSTSSTSTTTTCLWDDDFTGSDDTVPMAWRQHTGTPTIQGNTFECEQGEIAESLFTISGDFDIQVAWELTTDPATNSFRCGLCAIIQQSPEPVRHMKIGAAYDGSSMKYQLAYATTPGTEQYATTGIGTRTGYSTGWLRLLRVGNTMYAYYKHSGGDWILVDSGRAVGWEPIRVQLENAVWGSNPSPVVQFDNFRVDAQCPGVHQLDDTNHTNFGGYTISALPDDWTERWDASSDFEVQQKATGVQYGGRVLASLEFSNNWAAISWDDLGSDVQDVEVLARFTIGDDAKYNCGVVLRGSTDGSGEQGYAVTFYNDTLRYIAFHNGMMQVRSSVAKALSDGDVVWLRARIDGEPGGGLFRIRARMWLDGVAETTGSWNIDYQETVYDKPNGWCGLLGINNQYTCDFFGVGLGGASAVAAQSYTLQTTTTTTTTTTVTELHETDFSEYTLSASPSDWTQRWYGPSYRFEDIESCDCPHKMPGTDRHLRYWQTLTLDALLTWDDLDGAVKVETLCFIGDINATNETFLAGSARCSGAYNAEYGYLAHINGGALKILRALNGVWADISSGGKTINVYNDQGYWVRFRAWGTSLKVKMWAHRMPEPSAWDVEVTDANITSGGWVGIGGRDACDVNINYFAVGVGGVSPAVPAIYEAQAGGLLRTMPMAPSTQSTVNFHRAMALTIPAGYNRKLTGLMIQTGTSYNTSNPIRFAVYSGGSLSTGPAGATLVHDFGKVDFLTTAADNFIPCNPPVDIPNDAPLWLVFLGTNTNAYLRYFNDLDMAGSFRDDQGYWASALSNEENTKLPSTWPTDGGSWDPDTVHSLGVVINNEYTTTTTTTTTYTTSTTVEYSTDFSEYAAASPPSDWTERWQTTYAALNIIDAPVGFGGKYLRMYGSSTGRYGATWDDVGTVMDAEILARMRIDVATDNSPWLMVRASGAIAAENCYMARISGNTLAIRGYISGSSFYLASVGFDVGTDKYVWVRFRVRGNNIKARIWSGRYTDEPGTWDIEVKDTTVSAAGWVGIGSYDYNGDADIDYFAVGCHGASAQYPSTGMTTTTSTTTTTTTVTTTTNTTSTTTMVAGEDPGEMGSVVNIIGGLSA